MSNMSHESVCLQMLVFFVQNPDEWLTTSDAMKKYSRTPQDIYNSTKGFIRAGLLTRTLSETGRMRKENIYAPGPELLKMIGAQQ